MRHTRRAVLGGVLAGATLAVTGCRPATTGARASHTNPPHPLTGLLAGATALVAQYDAAIAALGSAPAQAGLLARLTALRGEHQTHVESLAKAMDEPAPAPSASASVPADPAGMVAALSTAEKSGAADAVTVCLSTAAQYAVLVGSIAACRATHVEALR